MHCTLLQSCVIRDSLGTQLQLALAKADSEQLARQIAEEQLSDVEKEKTMLELEIKELMSRHKNELNKKEALISAVCQFLLCVALSKMLPSLSQLCIKIFQNYLCTVDQKLFGLNQILTLAS